MSMGASQAKKNKVTSGTLGPSGTCCERAATDYMRPPGVEGFEVEFSGAHELTERRSDEVFVVHLDELRLVGKIGEIDTTGAVHGTTGRFQDETIEPTGPSSSLLEAG